MKPNFALSLSFDGIVLLHRAFPGWHRVGEVALDAPDLTAELAALRQKAQLLDPKGLHTKLVLPNEQIKYVQVDTLTEDHNASARAALEGATPYAVNDLTYAYIVDTARLHVAAVARETLAEAEAFAVEHAFNPVSIVAIPEQGQYPGEPFFGATQHILQTGVTEAEIARDMAAIRIIGDSRLPEPDPAAEPEEPVDEAEPALEEEELEAKGEPEPEAEPAPEPEIEPESTPEIEQATAPEPVADPGTEAEDAFERELEAALREEPDPEEPAASEDESAPDETPEQDTPGTTDEAAPETPEAAKPDAEAPEPDNDTREDIAADKSDAAAPATAFSSIRASRDPSDTAAPRLDGVSRSEPPARINLGLSAKEDAPDVPPISVTGVSDAALPEDDLPASELRASTLARLTAVPAPESADLPEPDAEPDQSEPAVAKVPQPEPEPVDAPAPVMEAPRAAAALSFFTRREATEAPALAAAGGAPAPAEERERMTVFGARNQGGTRGKPRFLGLILTAILLLFLIGVAAWASIFMDEGIARFFRDDDAPAVATLNDTAEDTANVELASLQPTVPLSAADDPATEILSRVTPQDLSPDEAMARYAATGIWQLAPAPPEQAQPTELQDFYQTSLDFEPVFQDAIALPATRDLFTDGVFFTPAAPPAADTTFVLDTRGFILATPDGALTPDGIAVFEGQPVAAMPVALTRRALQGSPEAEDEETGGLAPATATLRPKQRPEDAAEQIERAANSGRTLNELAALRPKLRPASVQELADAAARDAAAEAARAQGEAEAATAAAASTVDLQALQGAVEEAARAPDPFAGATAQAVSASLKPNTRPRNFANIVERTKRNQARAQQEAQTQEPVRVAAAQKVAPKIPSAASVSKAATERNALKFARVNLIGVYGTATNRRALVRMGNGRYKKVKVGDTLDGGRVRAIGDAELRYQKGGRNIVIKMPRG